MLYAQTVLLFFTKMKLTRQSFGIFLLYIRGLMTILVMFKVTNSIPTIKTYRVQSISLISYAYYHTFLSRDE